MAFGLNTFEISSQQPRHTSQLGNRTGAPVAKAAVRRRSGQTEIYSSDWASSGPGDRVPSEPPLTHPFASPDGVGHEMQKRSDSRSLSRRSVLDSTLGVSLQQPCKHWYFSNSIKSIVLFSNQVDTPTPTCPLAAFRATGRPLRRPLASSGPFRRRPAPGRDARWGGGQASEQAVQAPRQTR